MITRLVGWAIAIVVIVILWAVAIYYVWKDSKEHQIERPA